jgi:hypothetical protein
MGTDRWRYHGSGCNHHILRDDVICGLLAILIHKRSLSETLSPNTKLSLRKEASFRRG